MITSIAMADVHDYYDRNTDSESPTKLPVIPDSIIKREIINTDSTAEPQSRETPSLIYNYPSFKLPTFDPNLDETSRDWVDPSSGNLMSVEPLIHYKGRNGLDLDVVLRYNSCVWANSYSVFGKSIIPIYKTWCGLGWDISMGELILGDWEGFLPAASSIEIPTAGINSRVVKGKRTSSGDFFYCVENNPEWNIIANPDPGGYGYIAISSDGTKYYFERYMDSYWGNSNLTKQTYFLTKIEDGNGNFITIKYWKWSHQPDIGYIGHETYGELPLPGGTATYYYNRMITQIRDTKGRGIIFYVHFANVNYAYAPLLDSISYMGFDTLGNLSLNRVVFDYYYTHINQGGDYNEAHELNSITHRTNDGVKLKPAKMFTYDGDYGHIIWIWYPTHTFGYGPGSGGSGCRKFDYGTVTGLGMQYRRICRTHEWRWGNNEKITDFKYGNNSLGNEGWDSGDITNSTILRGNIFIAPPYNLYVATPGQYRKTMVKNMETGNYDIYYFLDEDDIDGTENFYHRQAVWGTCWKVEHYKSSGGNPIAREEYGYDLTVAGQSTTAYGIVPWGYRQLLGELYVMGGISQVFTRYWSNQFNQWGVKKEYGYVTNFSWGQYFSNPQFNIEPGWDNRRMTQRAFVWWFNPNYTTGKIWMLDRVTVDMFYKDTLAIWDNFISQVRYTYDTLNYNNYYNYYTMYGSTYWPKNHTIQGQYRGNLTNIRKQWLEDMQWHETIPTHFKYDVCGNIVRSIDPLGHETSYRYDVDFGTSSGGPPDWHQYAYLRKIAKYVGSDSICEGARWFYPQGLIRYHFGPNSTEQSHSWQFDYCRLSNLESICAPSEESSGWPFQQYHYHYFNRYQGGLDNHNYLKTEAVRNDQLDPNNPANRFSDQFHYLDYLGRLFQYSRTNPDSADLTWNVNHYYNEKGLIDTISHQFSSVRGSYEWMPSPGPMVNGFTQTLYDAIGRDTSVTYPPGTNEQDRVHYNYSNDGRTVTITDENDNLQKHTYDAYGRLIKMEQILPTGSIITEYQYDALGNLIQTSTDNGQYVITYIYDSMGRIIQKNDPNSGITNYIYDDAGNLRFIQDANHAAENDWVYKKYDDVNRLIEEGEIYDVNPTRADANNQNYPTNGSWRINRYYDYSYMGSTNPKGNLVREKISQDGITSEYMTIYSYDKRGRITSKTIYIGEPTIWNHIILTVSYEYDAQDNLIKITYPDNEATVYNLNGLMMCDTVKTAAGDWLARIQYNENERPDKILSSNSYSQYIYKPRDWIHTILFGEGILREYTYDNVGNVTNETREEYNVAYTYDELYRLKSENYLGSINKQISYSYDNLHNRTQMIDETGTTAYEYALNTCRLTRAGRYDCASDVNGNITYFKGYQNEYNYRNELSERRFGIWTLESEGNRAAKEDRYIYSYDGNGNRCKMINNKTIKYYIRDEAGRVIFETDDTPNILKNPNFNNGTDWSPWLTYTPGGSCTWTVVNDVMKGGFYSIRGTSKTDNWETFIQKVQFADCPYPFVISVYIKTQNLTGQGINLQVDFYNGTTFLGNKQSGLVTGTNNWVQVILPVYNGEVPNGTDRMDIFVRKFEGTGTVWIDCFRLEGGPAPTPNDAKYIYVNNTHIAKIDALGDPYFYLCDALGSPVKIIDKQSNIVKDETFKAFGEQLTSSGTFTNTHRFTGKEYEASGIYYFGARYYDPTLGRFLTPDPLGKFAKNDPRTINPFVYCSNNPLKYIDPDGLWQIQVRDGVMYAYRISTTEALVKSAAFMVPGVSMADCIIRSGSGDVTLKTSDWLFAALDITLPVASKVARAPGVKQALKAVDAGIRAKSAYESFSEYGQAKDLDPKIFSEFTEKTGIEQKNLGNRTRLKLGSVKSGEAKLNRRLLDKISRDVVELKRKEQEPKLHYGDPHYYVR